MKKSIITIAVLFLIGSAKAQTPATVKRIVDSVKVLDTLIARYKPAADTFTMYQRLRTDLLKSAYPNIVEITNRRLVDSARVIFRKNYKK